MQKKKEDMAKRIKYCRSQIMVGRREAEVSREPQGHSCTVPNVLEEKWWRVESKEGEDTEVAHFVQKEDQKEKEKEE